jgi:glycosyltransferase involved in cell wall biosynthesis
MRCPYDGAAAGDSMRDLLDDYITVVGPMLRTSLSATAIRNRSVAVRALIARAGLGDGGTLAELLTAAREGDRRWLSRIRRRADPGVLASLAQTMALQDLLPTDRRDSLAIFELLSDVFGPESMTPAYRGLHAQLAYVWQGPDRARELLRSYRDLLEPTREALAVDLLNPYAGPNLSGDAEAWPAAFGALLPRPGPTLSGETGLPPFDRLTSPEPEQRAEAPQRVSVVVTAFRPDQGLLTAVRSVLAQTWRNVEVIIVDDASPPEFDGVLEQAVALGERIRLVKIAQNQGTYAARNAGLDASGGEFVAFQDSDDWSHPRRLELQVRPLLDDKRLVATTSDGLSVTDELVLTRPGFRSGRFNPSSLLFRRDVVLRRLGYFDRLRKAADSEYIGRLEAVFGRRAVRHVEEGPLALIRLSAGSLSRAEIRASYMHPARVGYSSAYVLWHARIAAGEASAYRPRDGSDRPFPVAPHLVTTSPPAGAAGNGSTASKRAYDVIVAADWRFVEGAHAAALAEIRALAEHGLQVAILHLEGYRIVTNRRRPVARAVQELVNDGVADQVFGYEDVEARLLIVRHPTALQFPSDEPSRIRPRRVLIVADRAPARADGIDRRYTTAECAAAARRLFDVDPHWCPQDADVRAALRAADPELELTAYDFPSVVDANRYAVFREAAAEVPIVGTDLCDAGSWPADVADALAVLRRLRGADVRVRMPDRPAGDDGGRGPSWLAYEPADLDLRTFVHQLDFYLHFPHPRAVEVGSHPALEAAAAGCVVLLPERFAAFHGDAAVYCTPDQAQATVERYRTDRALYAEQSRRARAVAAKAHHRSRYLNRIEALLRAPQPAAPLQRTGP